MRALLIVLCYLFVCPALAQTSTTATSSATVTATVTPSSPKPQAPPGFEPIAGKSKRAERVNANALVAVSYGSIFALLIGYLVFLIRDNRRISKEKETLLRKIEAEKSSS